MLKVLPTLFIILQKPHFQDAKTKGSENEITSSKSYS